MVRFEAFSELEVKTLILRVEGKVFQSGHFERKK